MSYTNVVDFDSHVYASWQTSLLIDDLLIPFNNLSLEVNSNLEFAPFLSDARWNENKPKAGLREITGSFTIEFIDETYYTYIKDLESKNLKINVTNNGSYFNIEMPNIIFTDGGSLKRLSTGMLELDLSFTATSNDEVTFINETGNWETQNPGLASTTKTLMNELTDIIFKIKE